MIDYIKYPTEKALFCLSEGFYKQARTYAAFQFLYPGKTKISNKPTLHIADELSISEPTVYRHFQWLLNRNWLGKDEVNGWLFARAMNQIHEMESWIFARAAIMYRKDLQHFKAFLAGVVCASLVQTGKGQRTEPVKGGSEQAVGPISLSVLADTLEISKSTAYRLRKLADEHNYIKNELNLIEIVNWTPNELTELKRQYLKKIPVELLGYADRKVTSIDRIRYKKNKLYLQEPNLVKPLLQLKSRKGLSKYVPPNPSTNVIQE